MITESQIEKLKKLDTEATPGPWEVETGSPWDEDAFEVLQDGVRGPSGSITWDDHSGEVFYPADAALISAYRTAVPALIEALESAWAERDEALDIIDKVKEVLSYYSYGGPRQEDAIRRALDSGDAS